MSDSNLENISLHVVEEGDTVSANIEVPVSITANILEEGDVTSATITARQAVEIESRIPPDAKQAVRDFLEDLISRISETTGDLVASIPDELMQYSEIILIFCIKFSDEPVST